MSKYQRNYFTAIRAIGIIVFLFATIGIAQQRSISATTGPARVLQPQQTNQRLLQQGQQLEFQGKLEEALAAFQQYKEANPSDPNGWLQVGRILGRLRQYEEMEALWKEYLPKAPPYLKAQIEGEYGASLWKRGDFSGARIHWNNAISVNRNENSYNSLYSILVSYNITDEAIRLMQEGRKTLNNPTAFGYQLFQLYLLTMNPKEAALEAIQQVKINPATEGQWTFWLAQFSDDEEVTSTLCNEFNQAIKAQTSPAIVAAIYGLKATILFRSRQYDATFDAIALVDSLTGANGSRLLQLASQLLSEGETTIARKALETALRRQRIETPYVLSLLAQLEWQQGDSVKARERWNIVLDKFPSEPESEIAAQKIATSYLPGHPDDALKYADRAFRHPHAVHQTETRTLMVDAALAAGDLSKAEMHKNGGLSINTPDYALWFGTLLLQGFVISVLGNSPDSVVTASLSTLDQIRFDDRASVDAIRWRILWNALIKRPALLQLLRAGEREYVFHRPLTQSAAIDRALPPYDDAARETISRVIIWLNGSIESEQWVDKLLAHFPAEPRLPGLLLERAQARFRRGAVADALKDLELILKQYPGRPEEDPARQLLRKWSKEG